MVNHVPVRAQGDNRAGVFLPHDPGEDLSPQNFVMGAKPDSSSSHTLYILQRGFLCFPEKPFFSMEAGDGAWPSAICQSLECPAVVHPVA